MERLLPWRAQGDGTRLPSSRWIALGALLALLLWNHLPVDGTVHPRHLTWAGRTRPGVPNVAFFSEPWLRGCGSGCYNAYIHLVQDHPEHRRPRAKEHSEDVLSREAPAPSMLAPGLESMRDVILRRLNIGFLLDGLTERGLAVAVLRDTSREGYWERKLLFWDPLVGSFEGLLLVPRGSGPHPGVLALHGHRQTDETFAEQFLGKELARRGFMVLLPRFRVMDCSLTERRIASTLLRDGFTLLGIHVYEALLMTKYLRHLGEVDQRHLGLLSHSGGSTIATLLVRLSDDFTALVVDHSTDFRDRCSGRRIHCETVPSLVPIASDIFDPTTLAIARLHVPYRFPDPGVKRRVLSFLDVRLRPARRHGTTAAPARAISAAFPPGLPRCTGRRPLPGATPTWERESQEGRDPPRRDAGPPPAEAPGGRWAKPASLERGGSPGNRRPGRWPPAPTKALVRLAGLEPAT